MKVIAITSGKGGVGKTSMACSLAVSLQLQGQKVLVIDADLGLADLNIAFGVTPRHTLKDVADGRIAVGEAIMTTPSGVALLPAYAGSFDLANLGETRRLALLRTLEHIPNHYDTIIVDTGAGIGATAMTFAAAAHDVVVVTTRDPTAIADAYATIKVLSRRFNVTRVALLVNLVDNAIDAGVVHETIDRMCQRFLRCSVTMLGYVCRDSNVPLAWRTGQPVPLERPESPASHCVRVVASRLMSERSPGATGGIQLFSERLNQMAGMLS